MTLNKAKQRISDRPESETKEFALSLYFEDIEGFINYYTAEANAPGIDLGSITDLHFNKLKNRLFDCISSSEMNELLAECSKAKKEFYDEISNLYENQYKGEFNRFSFKEQTSFDWAFKNEALGNIKYYLKYKDLCIQINEKLNPSAKQPEPKPTKLNKSLLFDGKELNLSERYIIANKVLAIDAKIRTLKIPDLEKYQLLAYILGCDKDNARNIMNGKYNTKDRDLKPYFDDLGLNK